MGAGYGAGAYFFVRVYRTQALARGLRRRHLGGGLRTAHARHDAGPLRQVQQGRRAGARGDRLLRLDDRLHRVAVPRRLAVAAQPAPRPAASSRPGEVEVAAGGPARARPSPAARRCSTATIVLLSPSVAIDNWGWSVTPADRARARVLHGPGRRSASSLLSRDARWSSWRILVQTFLIAVALLLVGARTRVGRLRRRAPDDLVLRRSASSAPAWRWWRSTGRWSRAPAVAVRRSLRRPRL